MIPVIALVGRPNVGKSTLFNHLTGSRHALVADEPGVTRDRQYGEGLFGEKPFIVIDTGGIEKKPADVQVLMHEQVWQALKEANIVFWVVDGRVGLTATDQQIGSQLRALAKPIYLLVNKTDGGNPAVACAEFYATGFDNIFPVAATQGIGVQLALQAAFKNLPPTIESPEKLLADPGIKVAIIGRPNVGKSTLVNRILGEERVVVFDAPGTTRDSIFIPFERRGKKYTLIDTAGVRRRRSIDNALEQFSVVKTLQAVTEANVVVFVVDAQQELAEQDLHLLGYVVDAGKGLIIAVNKWDNLSEDKRKTMEKALDRRLGFLRYAPIHFISALHGSCVGDLFPSIQKVYQAATRKFSTALLTEILEKAVETHQPPAVLGRRIKLRYAHAGGSNPPVIVIHGNQTEALPDSYRRFLAGFYRDALKLVGTPVEIVLKSGDNPYKGQKNVLTERQVKRRKRLIAHVKKKN